jgi:hypothetical protein
MRSSSRQHTASTIDRNLKSPGSRVGEAVGGQRSYDNSLISLGQKCRFDRFGQHRFVACPSPSDGVRRAGKNVI